MVMQLDQQSIGAANPLRGVLRWKNLTLGAFDVEFQDVQSVRADLPQEIADGVSCQIAAFLTSKRPCVTIRVHNVYAFAGNGNARREPGGRAWLRRSACMMRSPRAGPKRRMYWIERCSISL
jgi:hypothetical protein